MAGIGTVMGVGFTSNSGTGLSPKPDLDDMKVWYRSREGNVLIDEIAADNKTILFPISGITSTSVMEGVLTGGLTIVSYEGDQILIVFGDNIVSASTGQVHSILLSDGTFIPNPYLGESVKNGLVTIFGVTDITGEYSLTGSDYMHTEGSMRTSYNISQFGVGGGSITYNDLAGINIISYEGTSKLTKSGNDIIGTEGTIFNLLIETGEFSKLPHTKESEIIAYRAGFNRVLDFGADMNFNEVINYN